MKTELIQEVCSRMTPYLNNEQIHFLEQTLRDTFQAFFIPDRKSSMTDREQEENTRLINLFIAAKKIEGCSDNTLKYYTNTLTQMIHTIQKNVCAIETNDLRFYLSNYQQIHNSSKVTLDNIRRIMSSFFTWLEDEDYILKSPVRRIHKVKATQVVKETLSDEHLERLRDVCYHPRDLAIIDLLTSTGIRVGELSV